MPNEQTEGQQVMAIDHLTLGSSELKSKKQTIITQ